MSKPSDLSSGSSQHASDGASVASSAAHKDLKKDITELRILAQKQVDIIEGLHEDNKKIKRRLFFIALGSNIRFVIFLIPLVLALIYVVPFVRENWQRVQGILNISHTAGENNSSFLFDQLQTQGIDVNKLLQQLQNQQ